MRVAERDQTVAEEIMNLGDTYMHESQGFASGESGDRVAQSPE